MWGLVLGGIAKFIVQRSSVGLLKGIAAQVAGSDDKASEIALKSIDAEIDARKGAREIRLATAAFWEMRLITFIIASIFTLHLVLVGLDTCFGFGWRIAKFPAPFDEWQGIILLSFFGVQVAGQGLNALVAAIALRR